MPYLNTFEKNLSLWVVLCMALGVLLGRLIPDLAAALDALSVYQVSLLIAICLFGMMYPIMVKIDFGQAQRALQSLKPAV